MINELREKFNREFTETKYHNLLNDVWQLNNNNVDFRICETPLFLENNIKEKLVKASEDIVSQLQKKEFADFSKNAIPSNLVIPNEEEHPNFLQIDFALTKNQKGEITPKLIELQAFPTIYAYQTLIDQMNRKYYSIEKGFTPYFNNYNFESYIQLLKEIIVAEHNPENVILLEIEPHSQKTRIDFYLTEKYLGVKPVCISEVFQKGNDLFYKNGKNEIPIKRIYSRVIFDELENSKVKFNFNYKDDLNVEWAGHPNWFFKISKYSMPFLKSEFIPNCFFLNEINYNELDLRNYVLKPLFSFAGAGVIVDVEESILESIKDKQNFILQEKVEYEPILETPSELAKTEIRMMYLWKDKPVLVNNLLRVSKGKLIGVDYNKNKTWIGANIAYHK